MLRHAALPVVLVAFLLAACSDEAPSGPGTTLPGGTTGPGETTPTGTLDVVAAGLSTMPLCYAETGFDTSVGVVLSNPSDLVATQITVSISIQGAGGEEVATTGSPNQQYYVLPGQEVYFGVDRVVTETGPEPVEAVPTVVAEEWVGTDGVLLASPMDLADLPLEATADRFLTEDIIGDCDLPSIEGTLTNQSSHDIDKVRVSCVLYAGGEVIGGGYTYVDRAPAGKDTPYTMVNGLIPWLEPDEMRCSANVGADSVIR